MTRDVIGERFGRWLVLSNAGRDKNRKSLCKCVCDCGTTAIVLKENLIRGKTRSCGCWNRDLVKELHKTHGKSSTSTYAIYYGIRRRCNIPTYIGYKHYGGRGIRCLWDSFKDFYADMGPRPSPKHSIDRYPDRDGDYCKDNCRWATRLEQNNNSHHNRYLEYQEVKKTITQWAGLLNLHRRTLSSRITKVEEGGLGWSLDRAFSTPSLTSNKKNKGE